MSILHVKQIQRTIENKLTGHVDMSDYASHKDKDVVHKAFLTRGLAVLSVGYLSETPIEDLARYVTDGSDDGGVDLIFYSKTDSSLYLVQTKWHDSGHGSIELGEVLKFISGINGVINNDIDGMNDKIKSMRADIEDAVHNVDTKFYIVVAHTGQEDMNATVLDPLNQYVRSLNDTSEMMYLRILKQVDMYKAITTGASGDPISVDVHITDWGQVKDPNHAVYGQVCASDVAGWASQYGARLFEMNLRHFIGPSVVNEDIVNTITKRPSEFWYFNNGVTAVATSLDKKPIGGNSKDFGLFACTGFCIVNGAQTVGSIQHAETLDKDAVSKAKVPIRIIEAGEGQETFCTEVTRYTNTQNAINKQDFVALDPGQERLRQELCVDGVEYTYKAGSSTGSGAKRFDLIEATIALACSRSEPTLAVQAKREISKLWEDITKAPYKTLFNDSVTGPYVWELVQVLRLIDGRLQIESKKYSARDALVCVHGNRFIQWAAMNALNLKPGASEEEVVQAVEGAVRETTNLVKTEFPDAYPASLFKNLTKCKVLADKMRA